MTMTHRLFNSNNFGSAPTHVAAPTIVSLSTDYSSTAGGFVITATGTNLSGIVGVTIGTLPGTAATGVSSTATTVTFTTPALAASSGYDVNVTTAGGTATLPASLHYVPVGTPTIEWISSDIGAAAGGTKLTIGGNGYVGGETVTIGGVAATSVVVAPNKISCVTPAGTASETAVDVVVTPVSGTPSTLSGAFEYLPAVTTTYASETFVSGFGALTPNGSVSIVNVPSARGTATKCVKCEITTTFSVEQSVQIALANNPLLQAAGLFIQGFTLIPSATMTLVEAGDQIKTLLNRATPGTAATLMRGVGIQFTGAIGTALSAVDVGITPFVGSANGSRMGDGIWVLDTVQFTRNAGTSTGRMRGWRNGKKVFNVTSSTIGGNTATDTYTPRLGLVFEQGSSGGTMDVYVADIQILIGYADPLES